MKRNQIISIVLLLISTTAAFSQIDPYISEFTKITDHIYKITSFARYKVNFIASVGEDGVLLVDTGFKHTGEELRDKIRELGCGDPKFIINTHDHEDHMGGNEVFGKDAIIIAHTLFRQSLEDKESAFLEIPDESNADIVFEDSLSVFFNGEEIKVVAFPGSHTNTDIITYFTKSKIAYLGDLGYGLEFPSTGAAGNATRYVEIIGKIIDFLPDDTKIVSGHGIDLTMDQYREFHDMLIQTTGIVRNEFMKGKDARTMLEEDVLAGWESFSVPGYQTTRAWIHTLVYHLSAESDTTSPKPSISYELYLALKKDGVDGVIARYEDLKNNHSDDYSIDINWIGILGYYYYLDKGMFDVAIRLFEYNLKENQNSRFCYISLGEAHLKWGDKKKALMYIKKGLEPDPEYPYLKRLYNEAIRK